MVNEKDLQDNRGVYIMSGSINQTYTVGSINVFKVFDAVYDKIMRW